MVKIWKKNQARVYVLSSVQWECAFPIWNFRSHERVIFTCCGSQVTLGNSIRKVSWLQSEACRRSPRRFLLVAGISVMDECRSLISCLTYLLWCQVGWMNERKYGCVSSPRLLTRCVVTSWRDGWRGFEGGLQLYLWVRGGKKINAVFHFHVFDSDFYFRFVSTKPLRDSCSGNIKHTQNSALLVWVLHYGIMSLFTLIFILTAFETLGKIFYHFWR